MSRWDANQGHNLSGIEPKAKLTVQGISIAFHVRSWSWSRSRGQFPGDTDPLSKLCELAANGSGYVLSGDATA